MRLPRFLRRPVDVRGECGTWRAGDLAVCIGDRWHASGEHNPQAGEILRVTEVDDAVIVDVRTIGLSFAGKPDDHFWDARGFRKPVPDDQPASADFRLPVPSPERIAA